MPTSSGQRLSNRRLEVPVDEVCGVEVGGSWIDEDVQTKKQFKGGSVELDSFDVYIL